MLRSGPGSAARVLACWALLVPAAGCGGKKGESTTGEGPAPVARPGGPPGAPSPQAVLAKLPGGDEFAAGKRVYANNGCARCHKLGETGGTPGMPGAPPGAPPLPKPPPGAPPLPNMPGPGGPNLSNVGADPEHTVRWLADHVREPKKHKPQSTMPGSGADKIGDADLTSLAEYLASRKDEPKK